MKLGDLIREYRESHDLSQRQFADRCGLSNGYISMLERHINPNTQKPIIPTMPKLKKLANGMGISMSELFEKVDDMPLELTVKDMISLYSSEYLSRMLAADCAVSSPQRIISLFNRLSIDPYEHLTKMGISKIVFNDWMNKGIMPPHHCVNALLNFFQIPANELLDSKDFEAYDLSRIKNCSIYHQQNTIRIFEKNGAYTERTLSDEQLSALKAFLAVLPAPIDDQED